MVNRVKAGEIVHGARKTIIDFHNREIIEDVDRRGKFSVERSEERERGEELKSVYVDTLKKLGLSQHYWKGPQGGETGGFKESVF